jgi:hypothetical protein
MPFLSRAQEKWAFTPAGTRALGGKAKVKEWADSTDQKSLPEKKGGVLAAHAAKKAQHG